MNDDLPLAIQFVEALEAGDTNKVAALQDHVWREQMGVQVDEFEADRMEEPNDPRDMALLFAEFRRHLFMTDGSEVVYFSDGSVKFQGAGTGFGLWVSPEPGTHGRRFLADVFVDVGRLEDPHVPEHVAAKFVEQAVHLGAVRLTSQTLVDQHGPTGALQKVWRGTAYVWSDGTGFLVDVDGYLREIDGEDRYLVTSVSEALAVVLATAEGDVEPTDAMAVEAGERAAAAGRLPGPPPAEGRVWVFGDGSVLIVGLEEAQVSISRPLA